MTRPFSPSLSASVKRIAFALAALLMLPAWAAAQGVLININENEQIILPRPIPWPPHRWPHPQPTPVPQDTYRVKSLEVNVKLSEQVAHVQVSQSFVNTGSRPMEVCFVFPLPYDGAVDQLTLLVNGKEFAAKLLPASEARKVYEDIVRKNRDPALLEWMGTGMFKTSVFPVPPGEERKVTLRYTQLCRQTNGLTDFLFPLSTARYTSKPVEEVSFHVAIDSATDIKNVYSPNQAIEIKRPDDKHAIVSYKAKDTIPTSDFRLFYDVGRGQVGTTVLSYRHDEHEDGYFLLLASPEIKPADKGPTKKTVVFVLDRSGSMSGEKIEQAKAAVKFVLNNLHEGDLFNVIAFDSDIESWKPELQKFNDQTRKAALGFVEGIYAGGSTNIGEALQTALDQLHDEHQPNFVLFMTDGLPTVGEQNEATIVANARKWNKVHSRIFTFGVGYDLNSRLLDKLAGENFGQSEFVRPNENIETAVSALYSRIGAPVLTDMKLTWDLEGAKSEDGKPVNRVYPRAAHDLFAGEQLVIVGRYKKSGAAKVTVSGMVGDEHRSFNFPANLVEHSGDESLAFIERLWAVRRVGEILDELDLKGKNEELVKELVKLSTRHGIITPYTSFLADDNANVHNLTFNIEQADRRLDALSETDGQIGVEQRKEKALLRQATTAPAASPLGSYAERAADKPNANAAGAPGQGYGGRGGGRFSFQPGLATSKSASVADNEELAKDAAKVVENVRTVGRKVFYRHGDRWVDSAVTEAQEKQPIKIERFSQQYFDLVEKSGREVAKYMAFDEPVIVELDGKAYAF
jgi:Ca-activated chloride channel family protein